MLPVDWTGDDPGEARAYLAAFRVWTAEQTRLIGAQASARTAVDAAEARLGVLTGFLAQLQPALDSLAARRAQYDICAADLSTITNRIAGDDGVIDDLVQSYAVATSRLLGEHSVSAPIVLLPLRIETHWTPGELLVRIFPDEIGVDTHDPRLTPAELAAGNRYWQNVGDVSDPAVGFETPAARQAWDQLERQAGPTRAAWIVRTCDPAASSTPETRESGWDTRVAARWLPDRFAVVTTSDQTFRPSASGAATNRYVTWGSAIPAVLDVDVIAEPGTPTWLTDFATAEANGMAVRIPLADGTASIETMLVVGIRGDATPDLAALVAAHALTGGVELLPDGAPTNNSDDVRAALDRLAQSDAARGLIVDDPLVPPVGTAGAVIADLLGVAPSTLAGIRGADDQWTPVRSALALLVGSGVDGALRDELGVAGASWPVVASSGPAATVRIGRQPYGLLPATAPGRWKAEPSEVGGPLTDALRQWALATGPRGAVDPATAPLAPGHGSARSVTGADPDAMGTLVLERPESFGWANAATTYAGVDSLVGPADGPAAVSPALAQIAATAQADLGPLQVQFPALLAQIALAAKQAAPDATAVTAIDAALTDLAAATTTTTATTAVSAAGADGRAGNPRADVARLLGAALDATSHRFDAWVTGAVTERLRALRSRPGAPSAVGAFGWLTDLAPTHSRRSEGHVLAPSLAHAATAAVMRSGYLAEREVDGRADGSRQPMAVDLSSARVRAAESTLAAVRDGQPLAAVLGRAFEDDLIGAGLQRYLATFRKLTRFRTGTALEGLEDARRVAAMALAAAQAHAVDLHAAATVAEAESTVAAGALVAAQQRQATAQANADPYLAMRARIDQLTTVVIPQAVAAVTTIDGQRPVAGTHHHTVTVPDP